MQFHCLHEQEIYSLADRISLRVPDIDTFVDNLNSVGYLLKKGPKTYQVGCEFLYAISHGHFGIACIKMYLGVLWLKTE